MRVDIRLQHAGRPAIYAWASMAVAPTPGERWQVELDVAAAVAADATSFLHPVGRYAAKAIRDELMTGLLRARQVTKTDFHAELLVLGAADGERGDPTRIPAIGYGVIAFLAAAHAVGHIDLHADPIGGYGWRMEQFASA
ncbi:MAG: hypothetical protein ACOCYN_00855 [Planctomycetota bacterium]